MSMPYLGVPRPSHQAVALDSNNVVLSIRQQPSQALVTLDNKEKVRKPIDPPPIVEMKVLPEQNDQWLVSPYLFMIATLLEGKESDTMVPGRNLIGGMTSSLHRLKDVTNRDGGFFIFGDISVRVSGTFRLRFNLFNTDKDTSCVTFLTAIDSAPFDVVTNKEFRGLAESTHLSRTFSDQGVRLRLRKEARSLGGNTSSLKRSHTGMTSPPESYTQQTHSSGFGGPVGDSHYSSTYGTPVKRQRSDSGNNTVNSYPSFSSNASAYYTNNPVLNRQYSSQGHQSYMAGQDYMSAYNLPPSTAGATLPPSTGAPSGSSVADVPAWSRPAQPGTTSIYNFGRTPGAARTNYFDSQQSRSQQPPQIQTDTGFGYGLATPTSNPDHGLGQNQGYPQSQNDYGSHTVNPTVAQGLAGQSQYQQELAGDYGSFENRPNTGNTTAGSHGTVQPGTAGLTYDTLGQSATGQYQRQQPTTTQGGLDVNLSMFDMQGAYTPTSGTFEANGLQNTASMSTLNSEWSGASYQTQRPGSANRMPQQSIESFGEHHSSGYPTPQTTSKW